jgi:hypothetical protein
MKPQFKQNLRLVLEDDAPAGAIPKAPAQISYAPVEKPTPIGYSMKKGGYVKGGKINLGSGRVSTTTKNKSNSNW